MCIHTVRWCSLISNYVLWCCWADLHGSLLHLNYPLNRYRQIHLIDHEKLREIWQNSLKSNQRSLNCKEEEVEERKEKKVSPSKRHEGFIRNLQRHRLCFVQHPPWGFLWRSHWRVNLSRMRPVLYLAQSVACWGNEALMKWQCDCMQP